MLPGVCAALCFSVEVSCAIGLAEAEETADARGVQVGPDDVRLTAPWVAFLQTLPTGPSALGPASSICGATSH